MQYTTYLRWALLGGLSLVFFIPFLIADGGFLPNMFFPFITGKNFAFRIVIEVLLAVYILLALREPKYRPKASLLLWAALAFVGWMALSTMVSMDPTKSFWSNFERMEGYVSLLHFFVFFVIAGAVATAEGWWDRLMQISITSSAIMGVYSVLQLLGAVAISTQSGARVDATFGNATYLAVFMLFNVFITLFMLVRQYRSTPAQVLYGLALVLQMVTIFYTQTRGSLLGVLGGLVIVGIYLVWRGKREWPQLHKIALWGLGVMVFLVVSFFALRHTALVQQSPTLNRLASISLADKTTQARFQIWQMAYSGFKDKPVLGWGQENFSYVFNQYYQPSMYSQEQWFDRAHNQFLDWLIAGGIPAFVLYLSLFVLAAWAIVRSHVLSVPEQAVLMGLLAAYGFNNLLVFGDLISSVYFFFILAFVHGISMRGLPGWMFLSKPVGDKTIAIVAPVVAVVCVVGVWALNAPGIARAQNMLDAVITQMQVPDGQGGVTAGPKDPKINLAEFTVALGPNAWPGTGLGNQEVMEQLLQFASAAARSSAVDPSLKQDIFEVAEDAGKAMLAKRPDDARLELFMGSFYNAYGKYADATTYLDLARQHSPAKQQILFEAAVARINNDDVAGALPILQQAFESEPSYGDARIIYVAGLLYAGKKAEADALLQEGFGTVLVDDARLVQVYTRMKQFDRVIGIWKNRIAANPKDSQLLVGLATAYFAAGDAANTIATLRQAAALNPALASQVQTLIAQIQNGTLKPGQ